MERDFYYVIEENGYHIFDRNNELFHVHQYEPYIPDNTKSYEENAQAQIEEFSKPVVIPERIDPANRHKKDGKASSEEVK